MALAFRLAARSNAPALLRHQLALQVPRAISESLVNRRSLSNETGDSSKPKATKGNHDLEILDLALTKVDSLGWTRESIIAAAEELGYSGMAHGVADGGIGLVSHFMDRALDDTSIEVEDQLHEFDNTQDKLRFICITRLRQTLPYVRRWPEAAALLAQPQNIPKAMSHLGDLTSRIWQLSGDQSVRLDWYARRSSLAAAYLATELYMCEDRSPNHSYTWDFLKRRLADMDSAEQSGEKIVEFGQTFGRNLYNIMASRGYVPY